jgi:hypothetical protein
MSATTIRNAVKDEVLKALATALPGKSEAELTALALDAFGLVYVGMWPKPERRVYAERVG